VHQIFHQDSSATKVGIKDTDFVFELLPESEGQFVVFAKANT
jgi:hypothetical protein